MPAGLGRLWGIPAALSRHPCRPNTCLRIALYEIPLPNFAARALRGIRATKTRIGLRLCLAGLSWFDPLCQPLVARSNLAQFQADIHVVHGFGSEQDFFGACSKAAGQRSKLHIQHWNAFERGVAENWHHFFSWSSSTPSAAPCMPAMTECGPDFPIAVRAGKS